MFCFQATFGYYWKLPVFFTNSKSRSDIFVQLVVFRLLWRRNYFLFCLHEVARCISHCRGQDNKIQQNLIRGTTGGESWKRKKYNQHTSVYSFFLSVCLSVSVSQSEVLKWYSEAFNEASCLGLNDIQDFRETMCNELQHTSPFIFRVLIRVAASPFNSFLHSFLPSFPSFNIAFSFSFPLFLLLFLFSFLLSFLPSFLLSFLPFLPSFLPSFLSSFLPSLPIQPFSSLLFSSSCLLHLFASFFSR